MSSLVDSLTGTTEFGTTIDPLSSPPPTDPPLNTLTSVSISPSITTDTGLSSSLVALPAPPLSSPPSDNPVEPTLVSTDANGFIDTTTVYSTQTPSSPTTPFTSNPSPTNASHVTAIIAGVAGGVGFLFLLFGVTWFIWVRRAKRRAGNNLINDRKFFPDRYNQTVTSNRHSGLDEIEPGPVVIQPPPHPPRTSRPPSDPFSRRTLSYHSNIPSSLPTHGNWVEAPPVDGVLGSDVPPLTRHRFPYPSSPQPLADRYTMLPGFRSTSGADIPIPPLRFAPSPPPPPHQFRSSSSTRHSHHSHRSHRSHHSHHSRHSHHNRQRNHADPDSYFPPIPMRMTRRNTIFASPTMSTSPLPIPPNPLPDLPATVTLTSRLSVARSTFSSIDSLVVVNGTKRMTITNPDSDIDLETDTEPNGSSRSGVSPSATDIIRLYDRDMAQDTSPTSSILRQKDDGPCTDPPTASAIPISMSTEGS